MFNSTNINLKSSSTTVQFNTPCTGILQRSHPRSVFIRFQKESEMERNIFPCNGTTSTIKRYDKYIDVTILQILIFGDNSFLVEVVESTFLNNE